MPKITTAIIPAAGFGTRFLPATESQQKEMLPVGDKLGFLQATVEFALQREDLREPFLQYLQQVVREYGTIGM